MPAAAGTTGDENPRFPRETQGFPEWGLFCRHRIQGLDRWDSGITAWKGAFRQMLRDRDLEALVDRVRKLNASDENQRRTSAWQLRLGGLSYWRGLPAPRSEVPNVPLTVAPEISWWAKTLGFDLVPFSTDPLYHLVTQLRISIAKFETFKDDMPIGKDVAIWVGAPMESSLFGMEPVITSDRSPWLSREHVIEGRDSLARIGIPDFHRSGMMPRVLALYREIREMLPDDFRVGFPDWQRGSWAVAFQVYGYENLLVDTKLNPAFVHEMMRYFTDCRKAWQTERASFLKIPLGRGLLCNDEVNVPTLSPEQYEEFVLPYEQELCRFHGGISYWHSCGDTGPLATSIRKLGEIDIYNVSPWTDVAQVREAFPDTPLEIGLHPVRDVLGATETEMREPLKRIADACGKTAFTVRADAIDVMGNTEEETRKVQLWLEVARDELNK